MRTDMGADAIEPSINSLDRGRTGSESCRSSQIETEDTDPEESREEMNGSPTPASSDSKHDARDTQKVVPFEYGEGEEEEGLEDYRHHLHLFDGNYPDFSQSAEFDELEQGEEYEEDSPYPEVRAAVSNMDDPSMPVNTIRMWVLGLFWAIVSIVCRLRNNLTSAEISRVNTRSSPVSTNSSSSDTLMYSSPQSSHNSSHIRWEEYWPQFCRTSGG